MICIDVQARSTVIITSCGAVLKRRKHASSMTDSGVCHGFDQRTLMGIGIQPSLKSGLSSIRVEQIKEHRNIAWAR